MTALAPLRRFATCLDGRRIPLNSEQRSEMQGTVPYWGANGIVDHVDSHLFEETLVLLGEDGAPFDEPNRNVAFLIDGRVWVNNHIHVLRPLPDTDPRYLTYALNAVDWMPHVGGSTRLKLTQDDMLAVKLPRPLLEEQRAIADYLDAETTRIDALIAKKQQLIHLLDERWKVQRSTAVLRAADPMTGLGDLPSGWSCPQLGVLIELQRGHDLPSEARREGPFPIVSSGGVTGRHDQAACAGPTVVTGRYGTVGEVYFIDGPCWPLNTTLYVTDFRGNDPRWVALVLESLPLDAESEKSAVGGINRNVIGKLRVPTPPRAEQAQIAANLLRAKIANRRAIDSCRRQIALLDEHKRALVTAAVSGCLASVSAAQPRGDRVPDA